MLMCAVAAAASAQPQDSSAGPAKAQTPKAQASKPQASKSKTTPKKHHKAATSNSAAAKSGAKSTGGTHHNASAKGKASTSRRKRTARTRGQQKIDSERAQSIQEALIREHYLSGEATGKWNEASEEAMRRYQGDHGWQTKTVPDSRALIKLGLGPSNDHLLNPESAMTTGPDMPRAASLQPTSHTGPPVSKTAAPDPVTPAPTSQNDHSSPQ
jgi:hypothetical protein